MDGSAKPRFTGANPVDGLRLIKISGKLQYHSLEKEGIVGGFKSHVFRGKQRSN